MKLFRRYLLLLVVILPFQAGPTATPSAPESANIRIIADGETMAFESLRTTPSALLDQAGVSLSPGDFVLRNGLPVALGTPLTELDPIVLQVQRAVTVDAGESRLVTTAANVAEALWELDLPLRISDVVVPAPETFLGADTVVTVTSARAVRIRVGGEVRSTRTAAGTVGEALQAGGLALQGLDFSVPDVVEPLPDDGALKIVRVQEEILLEQVSLPFETLTQPAPDLEIDTQQVVQVGQFGLQVSRVRVRYEDGVEVSRDTEAEWIAAQPSPRILGYGTNIVVRSLDTPNGSIEYWRAVTAYATSYSPCRLGISTCGNTTASGLPLEKGVVGVVRSWYNAMVFSQVYVPGYGVGVIADIGAGVTGQNWIDLGYSDDDWVSWSKTVTIYFLTPVPPLDQVLWILP